MDDALRQRCLKAIDYLIPAYSSLVKELMGEVDRLEQRASGPVELSACPACRHWSLSGFAHCPLCGSLKQEPPE